MVKAQYSSKWLNPLFQKFANLQNDLNPFLSFLFHNDWLQSHCWLSFKTMVPNFVVVVSVLIPIYCHISWGMPKLANLVENIVTLQGSRGRRIRRPGTKKIGFGRMVLVSAESPDARFFCREASQHFDLLPWFCCLFRRSVSDSILRQLSPINTIIPSSIT